MIRTKKRRNANKQTMLLPATPPPKPVEPSDGPVFYAKWSDETETRMSVYSSLTDLDVRRGIAVATAAYSSRKHVPTADLKATIVRAHFESNGIVIQAYTAEELGKTNKNERVP